MPRRSRPKRKVIKQHIAGIIEKMLADQSVPLGGNNIKATAIERANAIDEVCYIKHGDDGIAYQTCVTDQLKEASHQIGIDETTPVSSLFLHMSNSLKELNEVYSDPNFENNYSGIHKMDIGWLIHFIEMVTKRQNIIGLEQNISIAYFSSYCPLISKIQEAKKSISYKKQVDEVEVSRVLDSAATIDFINEDPEWLYH